MNSDTIQEKSDTILCQQCSKEFTPGTKRAKFCSDACKLKNNRIKKRGGIVSSTSESDTINTGKHFDDDTIKPTTTDQSFIDNAATKGFIDWYHFDKEIHDRQCTQCNKIFHTRLKLNRYCSPKCRDKDLLTTP